MERGTGNAAFGQVCRYGSRCWFLVDGKCRFWHSEEDLIQAVRRASEKDMLSVPLAAILTPPSRRPGYAYGYIRAKTGEPVSDQIVVKNCTYDCTRSKCWRAHPNRFTPADSTIMQREWCTIGCRHCCPGMAGRHDGVCLFNHHPNCKAYSEWHRQHSTCNSRRMLDPYGRLLGPPDRQPVVDMATAGDRVGMHNAHNGAHNAHNAHNGESTLSS
jgi:hypothetical protein